MPQPEDVALRDRPTSSPPPRPLAPPVVWPVVAILTAGAAAAAAGLLTFHASPRDGTDGWAELGAFLLALAVGAFVLVAAYVVGIVLAARHVFPAGRRAAPATSAVVLPVALLGFTAVVAQVTPVPIWPPVYVVAGAAALAAGPAAFAWSGSRDGQLRLGAAVLAVVALVATGALSSTAAASADTDRAAKALPLTLFDGRSTDTPFDGWRRDPLSVNRIEAGSTPFEGGRQTYLKYFTSEGVVFITMHSRAGACADSAEYRCSVVGELEDGQLRRYTRTSGYGYFPRGAVIDALVHADGTAVSVQGPDTSAPDPAAAGESARTVLEALRRVDRAAYEAATGAPLRAR